MKFFIAFAVIVAVAVASPLARSKPASDEFAELQAIIAAIHSPSTDPATAALLEEQLAAIIADVSPIAVGPAIIESSPVSVGPAIIESNPISVGPAIIDFPLPDGGAVTAVEPEIVNPAPVVMPSPVIVGEIPSGATPLVQIIVNVKAPESAAVVPTPADNAVVEEVYVPGPVNVVDHVIAPESVLEPIQVVEPIVPGPVNVVDNVVVEPVQVVEPIVPGPVNVVDNVVVEPVQVVEPIVVAPVIVGTPIIPAPAVVLPDELN